jgi:hypothetical protein
MGTKSAAETLEETAEHYRMICQATVDATDADAVVVIVINGCCGTGVAATFRAPVTDVLPPILEDIAREFKAATSGANAERFN